MIDRNTKKGRLENLHVFTAFITENPKLATLKSKQQMNPFFIKAGKVDCVILGLIIQIRLRVHITVWMGFYGWESKKLLIFLCRLDFSLGLTFSWARMYYSTYFSFWLA